MPGYDDQTKEIARNFAYHGYNAVMPNLYWREAPGASPDDAAATARAQGGVPDERLVGDVAGAMAYLKGLTNSNGKVGTIGYCSGGRQSFLAAVSLARSTPPSTATARSSPARPARGPLMVPIVDKTPNLSCPLLGLFGNDDQYPSPGPGRRARGGAQGQRQDLRVPPLPGRRATRSSPSTAPPTASRPRTTAGRRSSPSTASTCPPSQRRAQLCAGRTDPGSPAYATGSPHAPPPGRMRDPAASCRADGAPDRRDRPPGQLA